MTRIFVAVGTQLPFDRLVVTVDAWARRVGRQDVFAQIANSNYLPRHLGYAHFISPREFKQRVEEADIVIGHAGMGTIITALELGKPVLVMPRLARLNEQRNDHQLASARAFESHGRITVAWDEVELVDRLDRIEDLLRTDGRLGRDANPRLVDTIRDFLRGTLDPNNLGPSEEGIRSEGSRAAHLLREAG